MNNSLVDIMTSGIDTRALSDLIIELNITRRNSRSYPEGHQIIDVSLKKALDTYARLMSTQEEVIIGVAYDTLLAGGAFLEKSNPIYRDFAQVLYERGIGALVLHRGLTIAELESFINILGFKREDVFMNGGIEAIWAEARISAIEIKAIRYDMFSATEEETVSKVESRIPTEGLWERFARGLTQGLLNHEGSSEGLPDPELLADILNRHYVPGASHDTDYARAITDFMRQSDIHQKVGIQISDTYYQKLAAFAGKLNPALRRQFLDCTFDTRRISSESLAEGIIKKLSADVIIETLEDINDSQISVPPFVMGLLQQLGRLDSSGKNPREGDFDDRGLKDKIQTIFKEHAIDEYIPESYQRKLSKMISAAQIPLLGKDEVHDLMDMLDATQMERRISDILLFLLASDSSAEQSGSFMAKNLSDMCTYFLQTGDYLQLSKIIEQIKKDPIPADIRGDLEEYFLRREFLEDILNGLTTWGKTKSEEIGIIIREIGEPFIGILLDRLAVEDNMSRRRYLMDRLMEFGLAARSAIMENLSDSRWYFLRNLIIMIRSLNLISSLEKLRPLADHEDQRVRQEALKTLLYFHDYETELRIMNDLESKDREVRIAAVRIAEKCASPDIFKILLDLITRQGLSNSDYELRSAIVQTLAEIGDPKALPALVQILGSRNLLRSTSLNRLKLEIVRSLDKYPPAASRPVLAQLATGSGPVAQQASQSLRNLARYQQ